MNFQLEDLLKNIEKTRVEMISLAFEYGYTSPAVVQCSQKLDLLLNNYRNKSSKSIVISH